MEKLIWSTLLASVISLSASLYWFAYRAYPILWQKAINQGRSWIYLPKFWKGSYRTLIRTVSHFLTLLTALFATLTIHIWKPSSTYFNEAAAFAGTFSAILIFRSLIFHFRYNQQLDSYFTLRSLIYTDYETKGKDFTESEINNITSFRHQNLLREADAQGKLLAILSTKTSQTKNIL